MPLSLITLKERLLPWYGKINFSCNMDSTWLLSIIFVVAPWAERNLSKHSQRSLTGLCGMTTELFT